MCLFLVVTNNHSLHSFLLCYNILRLLQFAVFTKFYFLTLKNKTSFSNMKNIMSSKAMFISFHDFFPPLGGWQFRGMSLWYRSWCHSISAFGSHLVLAQITSISCDSITAFPREVKPCWTRLIPGWVPIRQFQMSHRSWSMTKQESNAPHWSLITASFISAEMTAAFFSPQINSFWNWW